MSDTKLSTEPERLFDEICNKLNELTARNDSQRSYDPLDKMQFQLKKSQEELIVAQQEIEDRIRSLDGLSVLNEDHVKEVRRLADQLDQERVQNSKISSDLAKSLELNLKLQYEIEEVKTKSHGLLVEERKHIQYLSEKLKSQSSELDLAQAFVSDARMELTRAKERFHTDQMEWQADKYNLNEKNSQQSKKIEELENEIQILTTEMKTLGDSYADEVSKKTTEVDELSAALSKYQEQAQSQSDLLKNLSQVAEKKIVELKMALDRKSVETQDYYSNLQQALTQVQVLKQENLALRDYIAKISALHQQAQAQIAQSYNPGLAESIDREIALENLPQITESNS